MNCPFINSDDSRCSEILNIQHLKEAFERCTNHYTMCPVYIQLKIDEPMVEPAGYACACN